MLVFELGCHYRMLLLLLLVNLLFYCLGLLLNYMVVYLLLGLWNWCLFRHLLLICLGGLLCLLLLLLGSRFCHRLVHCRYSFGLCWLWFWFRHLGFSMCRPELSLYWKMYFAIPEVPSVPLAVTGIVVVVGVPALNLAVGAVASLVKLWYVFVPLVLLPLSTSRACRL